jgi:hypothetical protein
MKLTPEQSKMLDELIVKGYTEKETTILDGNVIVVFRSLTTEDQLSVEREMKSIEGTPLFTVHSFSVKILSYVLRSYKAGSLVFTNKNAAETEAFIKTRATVVTDALVTAHSEFEKELKEMTSVEVIKENFTQTPSSATA